MNQHPKRRKCKDNYYELIRLGNHFIVRFKDVMYQMKTIEVSEEIYQAMNQFELDDLKILHEFERHIEHSEVYEETLYNRLFYKEKSLEDIVIMTNLKQDLIHIMKFLPYCQRKRIILYFFQNLSLEQIANIEGTSHQAISKSIKSGISKMRKMSRFSNYIQ